MCCRVQRRGARLLTLFAVLAALGLSGCGTGGVKSSFRGEAPAAKPAPQKPQEPTAMDTFRAMAQPAGIKLTPLFLEPATGAEDRFQRLEGAVQDLRDDFDTVVPTLVRLAAVEKDMKDLVGQLKALTAATEPYPAATPSVAAVAPPPKPPAVPAPPPQKPAVAAMPVAPPPAAEAPPRPAGPVVRGIRIGDHPGKTRIVLDLDAKTAFKTSLQEDRRKLVIDIAGAAWNAKPSWIADSGNLVAGYRHENGVLTLDLISPGKILSQDIIPGEGGKGYRIIVEVAGESAL